MVNQRVPSDWIYVAAALWLVCVTATAFATSAVIAVRVLAASMVVIGLARGGLPAGFIPTVRSRLFDVSVYMLLASVLAYLSSWAAIPVVM
ncbi:MAG: hypothetical protein QM705_14450 [Ancrocorticia sp.]